MSTTDPGFFFEKASGHHVQVTWGGTPDITRLAEEGGVFDLVVIPQPVVADLERRGKLRRGGSRESWHRPSVRPWHPARPASMSRVVRH
jgi:hypothetical protein